MNLFEQAMEKKIVKTAPLALRMRPQTLDEFEEQAGIVGRGTLLRKSIEADNLRSAIFFGPPGTGKTTLAAVIAGMTKSALNDKCRDGGRHDIRRGWRKPGAAVLFMTKNNPFS